MGESELVAGRYRVLRELARGGVGAVYDALDESTGERVALKRLLHDAQEKPRLALLFEAEYDTLARLSHPRIVQVFDYGIDKRGPYYTMELLDGRDLSELEPIPYRDACRYLRDVASSLALLHTRQRLHRDLSPRNVRLTSDGRCRLLDFGTMANFGVADEIVGTPPMVPPEALRGTALDHRADLYSLGALAYRVLTGRYPYRARQLEDLPELWRTPPVPLRELAPELPEELDELVMSMLNLDPAYRPNTTYEVIDRLTAIGELPPDEDRGLAAQGYLVGSRLIGRARQMNTIARRIARAHHAHGCTVIIEGNPGVGKSRLLDEAALQAQLTGALTVRVDARAHQGQYEVVNAIIKAILEAAPHDARETAQPYLGSLSQVFPAFAGSSRTRPLPPSPAADGGGGPTRQQLRTDLLNWLFDLSEDRTLVILVDDLTRVDEASATLLNALAQSLPKQRIMLIAARRLVDKAPAPAGVEAIAARARRLRLHRLRREGTLALIHSLFGLVPNAPLLADWIHDVTTGSPMQIMELARHLVRENIVRFVDGLWVIPPNVPRDRLQGNLAATLSARAAGLSKPERALAEALCVRRGPLPLQLCKELSDDKRVRSLFRNLDELVAKGVLVNSANVYHFGQEALRQVLLRQLPAKRARRLHQRLGEALLASASTRPEDLIEAGFSLILGGAEVRGADLVAGAALKVIPRGLSADAALPAIEAALELYEKWGRAPRECLRLRVVLVAALDQRCVASYGDATLELLCAYAGGELSERVRPWLGARAGFLLGYGSARLKHWLTPARQRGPTPRTALGAFYRAAFSVLSVRSATLDVASIERLVQLTQSLAKAGRANALIAETFRGQLLGLRGAIAEARRVNRQVIERIQADAELVRQAGPAAVSGMLTTANIGLGVLEAYFALHSRAPVAIIDELTRLSSSNLDEPSTGALTGLELGLIAHQLRLAYHLARGERTQADARSMRFGAQTGMQHQLEVFRNLIDCKMSARALDVAGLRRCVETFTHDVAEHPELVPWLEIARAHLALCLGKPQEALITYQKWSSQIQPGTLAVWDTLCSGYADALLASGDAARARAYLSQLLEHRVLKSARDSDCHVTLEATLAWAEAECQALDAASARIERLEHEVADADHPIVVGFVHEVAARIAHRRRDEAALRAHIAGMKRWYGSTRNAAFVLRAQRVQDGLRERRPSQIPPPDEPDRTVVTRVSTRRESPSDMRRAPTHALQQTVRALLALAGGKQAYLYIRDAEGFSLAHATASAPGAELEGQLRVLFGAHTGEENAGDAPEQTPQHFEHEQGVFGLYWLHGGPETRGVLVVCANASPLQPLAAEALAQLSAHTELQ